MAVVLSWIAAATAGTAAAEQPLLLPRTQGESINIGVCIVVIAGADCGGHEVPG